ncbi:MAG TPA: leucyl aminopeptidase family protein [Polyangiaceae bacterium]|nr:leucyl aminopeptidase family protein [Polyangiaceae bacterium]
MKSLLRRAGKSSIPIHLVDTTTLVPWLATQPKRVAAWVKSVGYRPDNGTHCLVPGKEGELALVIASVTNQAEPWGYASLPSSLPKQHSYQIAGRQSEQQANAAALGWALGCYRFSRYKKKKDDFAALAWPSQCDQVLVAALAEGIGICRDLINTPASDLGPEELTEAGRALAHQHKAKAKVITGQALLRANFPMVHAVGRASSREPRLLDLRWGNPKHPKVTLVGKGVCFDSGGLDIKPANDMKLMKKDMGGAALLLGLAHVLMSLKLPICLRVLIPAVENSVSGDAMRPMDILASRKGLSVEIGNTDAEGRLILADALTEASEEATDLIIDAATLTGAARVALGTALPALFSNDDQVAEALLEAGKKVGDPLWRLPLHDAYRRGLDSKIAEINNITSDSYAGAITAALFLREFVNKRHRWMHIDTMAYNLEARPGRPVGGEAFGLRALTEMLRVRYAPR